MKIVRFVVVLGCASLLASALGAPASAQFSLPGGLDPRRAATGAAAKQLAPYIMEQSPIKLDPVELYPTLDVLPGAPFAPAAATQAPAVTSIIQQLHRSNTGTVSLAPGDYAISVRQFCMSHSRPARSPLAFVLGPMRGHRAPAIIAMNSRASSTPYQFSPIQTTSWTIQGGLGYSDFPGQTRSVVDALIPEYKGLLGTSTLDDIQGKWSSLSSAAGGPSLDSVLGQLGGAGQLVVELRDMRNQIIGQANDFNALSRSFAPLQPADVSTLQSPWSVVSPSVWMRLVTHGHYGDVGTMQVRVAGAGPQTVPLISSIGYGRCTPQLTTAGNAYACTQPLSFEVLRGAPNS
ncbi:MAG TPA: hypothetical protein VHT05_11855 [Candidatus Elarobacter sp.]|jgi:hypothetical protein|nr:hypothetical protein [Candidatus Elarobacter sp.]